MTDPERYVSTSELEEHIPFTAESLGIGADEWDAELSKALGAAADDVEDWTDTRFELTDASATLSRPCGVTEYELPLPKRPIESVTSVEIDDETLAESEYVIHETHLELEPEADTKRWPTTRRSVSVEWNYGYGTVPGRVRDVIIRLARAALDRIKTDGLESEALGDGTSYSYRAPSEIRREAQAQVSEYKAPSYYGGAQVI